MYMIVKEAFIANLPSIAKLTDNHVRSAPDSIDTNNNHLVATLYCALVYSYV